MRGTTRVVLLTPPGRSAVATVLVEGSDAAAAIGELFRPASGRPLAEQPIDRIVFGRWQATAAGEEVVVCRRAGEQVEIHCHGGRAAAAAIMRSLVERGCEEVPWHDWIRLSAQDPLESEARVALAAALTERTAWILWDQHEGALRRAVQHIAAALANSEASAALQQVDELLALAPLGSHLTEPWKVVLAGRPNVGKSSLINSLVGYQRAIVHDRPGTTRDVVTAATAVDGWPIELSDTAGIHTADEPLEAAGIERARDEAGRADLVVLVFDRSVAWSAEQEALIRQWPQAVVVLNKCDLAPAAETLEPPGMHASATRGDGVAELAAEIARRLVPHPPAPGQAVPFTPRQTDALRSVRRALAEGHCEAAGTALSRLLGC